MVKKHQDEGLECETPPIALDRLLKCKAASMPKKLASCVMLTAMRQQLVWHGSQFFVLTVWNLEHARQLGRKIIVISKDSSFCL